MKLLVLENLPDVQTLLSIIQASRSMLDLYLATRERILTAITINELILKGLDILTPAALLQIRVNCTGVPGDIEPALKSLYDQIRTNKGILHLTVCECKALWHLEDIVRWEISREEGGREDRETTFNYQS